MVIDLFASQYGWTFDEITSHSIEQLERLAGAMIQRHDMQTKALEEQPVSPGQEAAAVAKLKAMGFAK